MGYYLGTARKPFSIRASEESVGNPFHDRNTPPVAIERIAPPVSLEDSVEKSWQTLVERAKRSGSWREIQTDLARAMKLNPVPTLLSLLHSQGLAEEQPVLIALALEQVSPSSASAVITALKGEELPTQEYHALLDTLINSVATQNTDTALQLILTHGSDRGAFSMSDRLIDELLSKNGTSGLSRLETSLRGVSEYATIVGTAAGRLAQIQPLQAIAWLNQKQLGIEADVWREALYSCGPVLIESGHGGEFDQIARSAKVPLGDAGNAEIAAFFVAPDPERALRWLSEIQSPAIRDEAEKTILNQLAELHPEILAPWLKANSVKDQSFARELRQRLAGQTPEK